jgi:hypothetical protein
VTIAFGYLTRSAAPVFASFGISCDANSKVTKNCSSSPDLLFLTHSMAAATPTRETLNKLQRK